MSTHSTDPQTAYAQCKVLVERDVGELADEGFSPVFLRNATAYGASPRMRFDIVLNNLCGHARTTGKIAMTSDGTPWRPLVHVLDICKAVVCAIEAPTAAIHNEIFNVGSNEQNYQIRDIAAIVAEVFSGCEMTLGPSSGDQRSYRVSFDKIHARLPNFQCDWNARKGVCQLHRLFHLIGLDRDRFEFRAFTRLSALKHLIDTGQIDAQLFWTTNAFR